MIFGAISSISLLPFLIACCILFWAIWSILFEVFLRFDNFRLLLCLLYLYPHKQNCNDLKIHLFVFYFCNSWAVKNFMNIYLFLACFNVNFFLFSISKKPTGSPFCIIKVSTKDILMIFLKSLCFLLVFFLVKMNAEKFCGKSITNLLSYSFMFSQIKIKILWCINYHVFVIV